MRANIYIGRIFNAVAKKSGDTLRLAKISRSYKKRQAFRGRLLVESAEGGMKRERRKKGLIALGGEGRHPMELTPGSKQRTSRLKHKTDP